MTASEAASADFQKNSTRILRNPYFAGTFILKPNQLL
jgi:hypothetical protein